MSKTPKSKLWIAAAFAMFGAATSAEASSAYYEPFDSIASLEAASGPSTIAHAIVAAYLSGGNGGGGAFDYSSAALTADSCNVFPASGGGFWVREQSIGAYDVRNCGAIADGVTDNLPAFAAANTFLAATGGTMVVPGGTAAYDLNGRFNQSAGVKVTCENNPAIMFTNAASGGDWAFQGSNAAVTGNCNITFAGAQGFFINGSNISNVTVDGTSATSTGGIIFQDNAVNSTEVRIQNNTWHPYSYGVILGSSMSGGDIYIHHNTILNGHSDEIEVNTASGNVSHVEVTDNILDSRSAGSGSTSGFAIGAANTQGLSITGNHILGCRNECLHVEASAANVVIANNVVTQTTSGEDCIDIYGDSPTPTHDVSVLGNQCTASNAGTGLGIRFVYDGSLFSNVVVDHNTVNAFGTCLGLPAAEDAKNNLFIGCTTGVSVSNAIAQGGIANNTFKNVTLPYSLKYGGDVGRTRIEGTIPSNLVTMTFGTAHLHGITIYGTAAFTGTPVDVIGRPFLFMGTASGTVSNASNQAQYTSALTNVSYQSGGAWTVLNSATRNATLSGFALGINTTTNMLTVNSSSVANGDYIIDLAGDWAQW